MFKCPHCEERSATFEDFADHLMMAHDYAGIWESDAEQYRVGGTTTTSHPRVWPNYIDNP